MKKFINVSNHPSIDWSEKQKNAARDLGEIIVDVPFPKVPVDSDGHQVAEMGSLLLKEIYKAADFSKDIVVHLMGEQALCFFVGQQLLCDGAEVVVSTAERRVEEEKDGTKKSIFKFGRFRSLFLTRTHI